MLSLFKWILLDVNLVSIACEDNLMESVFIFDLKSTTNTRCLISCGSKLQIFGPIDRVDFLHIKTYKSTLVINRIILSQKFVKWGHFVPYVILKTLSSNASFLPSLAVEHPHERALTKLWCNESFHYYFSFIKDYVIWNSSKSTKFCKYVQITRIFLKQWKDL